MNTLYIQPDSIKVQNFTEKTLALKIMSLDFNTADKYEISKSKTPILPKINTK